MKSLYIILFSLGIFEVRGQVDSLSVEGQIFSKSNQPLAGVSVILKGSKIGIVSGICGEYQLTIPTEAMSTGKFVFNFLSETPQEFELSGLKSGEANFRLIKETSTDNDECSERTRFRNYRVKNH